MQEKKRSSRRPAGTQRQLTERQRAARTRQILESRSMSKEERRKKAGAHHSVAERQSRSYHEFDC